MYYLNFTTSILLQKYFKKALHIVLLSEIEVPEFTSFQLLNSREYASVICYIGAQPYQHVLEVAIKKQCCMIMTCLLYTSPSPRDS